MRLIKIHKDLFIIDVNNDLIFSFDDNERGGKGWYIQNNEQETSQLFASKKDALKAFVNEKLKFD